MLDAIYIIVVAYLFGSIPTAIIAGKLMRKIDIRDHGSGNAGATNVNRVLGWKAALVVLLIDMLKGFIPVFWLAAMIHNQADTVVYYQILAAISAIVGHIWTIFAGFRGGKGVGTSAGVFMGLAPIPLLTALLFFIIIVAVSKYVSLGSILAALVFFVVISYQKFVLMIEIHNVLYSLSVIVVVLLWFAHRENIGRLLKGEESKVSFSRSEE